MYVCMYVCSYYVQSGQIQNTDGMKEYENEKWST
jgi:hypothetical protein